MSQIFTDKTHKSVVVKRLNLRTFLIFVNTASVRWVWFYISRIYDKVSIIYRVRKYIPRGEDRLGEDARGPTQIPYAGEIAAGR